MPELPEVETVRRGLEAGVVGRTVAAVTVLRPEPVRPSAAEFVAGLSGRRFVAARRVGKHLFCDLDDGACLASHLRMTGQWLLEDGAAPCRTHVHLRLALDDGRELRWRDVRRFGWVHWLPPGAPPPASLAGQGPDALVIGRDEFIARLSACRRQLKALLLAQDQVAGLGNIYADEILWQTRLHPRRRTNTVPRRRLGELYDAMQATLTAAITARGTSFDSQYRGVDGTPGGFQRRLAAYGREGEPCPRCGRAIRREVIASRSAHYCPACQRLR